MRKCKKIFLLITRFIGTIFFLIFTMSLVTSCLNSWKSSCFFYQGTSYFKVKVETAAIFYRQHQNVFCGRDFYRRLTVQSFMSCNYRCDASIFLKYGEIIVKYFFYKRIFGFPPFCFYYLFEAFSIQAKKSSFVSGNRPRENFLSLTRRHIRMCIGIHILSSKNNK